MQLTQTLSQLTNGERLVNRLVQAKLINQKSKTINISCQFIYEKINNLSESENKYE